MDCIRRNYYTGKSEKHYIKVNKIIGLLINQFLNKNIIIISAEVLNDLFQNAELLFEMNTLISDFIRLFKINEKFWVQERSNKNEFIIRQFDLEYTAKKFIDDRMQIYDKMWDGCGCKIDYYI